MKDGSEHTDESKDLLMVEGHHCIIYTRYIGI